MGDADRPKTSQATKHVSGVSYTVITEVIDKDEDKGLTLTDRFAAVAAAGIVCGLVYFVIWLSILFQLGRVDAQTIQPWWAWIWSWHTPFAATAVTGVLAFFRPSMAYRYFGKVAHAFSYFLMYWG